MPSKRSIIYGCLLIGLFTPALAFPTSLARRTTKIVPQLVDQVALAKALSSTAFRSAEMWSAFQLTALPGLESANLMHSPQMPQVPGLIPHADVPSVSVEVELIPRTEVYNRIFWNSSEGNFADRRVLVPHGVVGSEKALYRGIRLRSLDELKNILVNGLETDKGVVRPGEVYTSFDPLRALNYTIPSQGINANLPVLMRIPYNSSLQQYLSSQDHYVIIFEEDLPASVISDVWVLLSINDRADWCKVVLLEDGKLAFVPGYGEWHHPRIIFDW